MDSPTERPPELDVSVVLPVHNEAEHLEEELDRMKAALETSPFSFELIVVDDGSTDASGEILRARDDIKLIEFSANHGSGFARKIGTRAARGRAVVWTDVDMTYPNDEIPRLVKELEGYDQVVGARRSEQGTAKAFRVPAKWILRKLASYLTNTKIPDLNSGFRAFRRDVALQYLHLLPRGFSCVTTMTMTFLSNGYSVKYFPIDYAQRSGRSKFHWWTDSKRYLSQILRMVLSYEPLRVFMPVALVLFGIGLGKLGFDLVDKNFRVGTNTLVILFAAFQIFSIGLLADLVVRLQRPRDTVDPESF